MKREQLTLLALGKVSLALPRSRFARLLGVPIQPEDAGLLCVHFQPTSEHRDGAHDE